MAKFSRKGWSSDFNPDNFTCGQMDRHVEGLRDDLYGRHNPVSRPGKTIHPHKPVGEAPREFTSDELFATMVEAAKNGDCQRQFLAGLGYAKRGDMKNAKYWLKKAADRNWPEAREKFDELFGTHHVHTQQSGAASRDAGLMVERSNLNLESGSSSTLGSKFRITRYRIRELPFGASSKKFYLVVKVQGFNHWWAAPLVAGHLGFTIASVYDSIADAKTDGHRLIVGA